MNRSFGFQVDFEKAVLEAFSKSHKRNLPVSLKDVEKKNPVSILEDYSTLWPPRDIRYDELLSKRLNCFGEDSKFMEDMFEGMELRVIQKIPTKNQVRVGVYFQTNMAEFEKYNAVAYAHNKKWVEHGMKEEVFDPVHGNCIPVKDQFVDYAKRNSPYIPKTERNPFGTQSNGAISMARPEAKKNILLEILYQLDIVGGLFRLGYVVYDYKARIVYYNETKGNNLSLLTRRATQEIFGHPFLYIDEGPFLDGIPLLIQGKKIPICKQDNVAPSWMKGDIKNVNVDLSLSKGKIFTYSFLTSFFSYIFPLILLFWGIILAIPPALKTGEPLQFILRILIVMIIMYFSVMGGKKFRRAVFEEYLKQKFI